MLLELAFKGKKKEWCRGHVLDFEKVTKCGQVSGAKQQLEGGLIPDRWSHLRWVSAGRTDRHAGPFVAQGSVSNLKARSLSNGVALCCFASLNGLICQLCGAGHFQGMACETHMVLWMWWVRGPPRACVTDLKMRARKVFLTGMHAHTHDACWLSRHVI